MTDRKLQIRLLLCAVLFALFGLKGEAAIIKGHVFDSKTKESLLGAVVYNKTNNQQNAVVGFDGSYSIKNLAPGTYTFVSKFIGYVTLEESVVITDANQTVVQDFLMDAQLINLGQVVVQGNYEKGSDNYARSEEKNSDNELNVVSSKTIQLLPDITIGDVLQRVSGVVAEKSVTGGGKYATIRGMDKRYNYTTIDGVKIPSPDYKNRYVPMDIFPAEMVERLEVIKTLTPDMEGDAIGGAMNLVLRDAPDQFSLTATASTGYDQNLFNKGYTQFNTGVINPNSPNEINGLNYEAKVTDFPTANLTFNNVNIAPDFLSGFTVGDRFLGGKLGFLASASYQNVYSDTKGLFIKPQAQPLPGPTFNYPEWDYVQSRNDAIQQTRSAAHVKLDYELNKKNTINFYALYAEMTQVEARSDEDTVDIIPGSELDPHFRSLITFEHIFNTTLNGVDTLARNLSLDWTAAYSRAWANTPDWDDLTLTGIVGNASALFSSLSEVWMNNSDEDIAGYINLTYTPKIFGHKIEFKAGAMNRDKTRDASYNEYDFNATPTQLPFTNISAILDNPNYYAFIDPGGTPQSSNNYNVQEDITAYYGMAKLMLTRKIQLLGGLRVENTAQAYQTDEPAVLVGKDGTKQYTDYLPSGEIKYIISSKMALRASYFASISRPSFFEIVPYQFSGDYYTEVGNPYLVHTTANNYDLRWEYFPKPSEQILAGVFYKQIYDPIELAVERGSGPTATQVQPINVGGDSLTNPAINYGFEFVITKYFKNFGTSANYTYTHSSITVPELKYGNSVGNSQPKYTDTMETRPLQGQVDNLANLSLIYKAPKIGLEAQVSVVYTGKSISDVSLYYGLELWQMPMARLDFSFEKTLSKKYHLSIYGKANNILNTPLIIRMFPPGKYDNLPGSSEYLPEQDTNDGYLTSIIVEKETYGQNYILGIRYKF